MAVRVEGFRLHHLRQHVDGPDLPHGVARVGVDRVALVVAGVLRGLGRPLGVGIVAGDGVADFFDDLSDLREK
ncbi:hypothetical protein GCM10007304_10510 [Rhodococcoides trifolii]|uniref:Uncharacterized protein n=1 Tax=Rhodococcoides trifolii TaxID=908250 RepID=A0A917CVU4_9NOCA|nr:hypothetical protein GCM10007304_10510 [Rhodococcus trifolii]